MNIQKAIKEIGDNMKAHDVRPSDGYVVAVQATDGVVILNFDHDDNNLKVSFEQGAKLHLIELPIPFLEEEEE